MFPCAIPVQGADHPRVTHPSAASPAEAGFARLACLRRAASVRSEPGSNSPSLIPIARGNGPYALFVLSCRSLTNRLLFTCSLGLTEAPLPLFLFLSLPLRSMLPKIVARSRGAMTAYAFSTHAVKCLPPHFRDLPTAASGTEAVFSTLPLTV